MLVSFFAMLGSLDPFFLIFSNYKQLGSIGSLYYFIGFRVRETFKFYKFFFLWDNKFSCII